MIRPEPKHNAHHDRANTDLISEVNTFFFPQRKKCYVLSVHCKSTCLLNCFRHHNYKYPSKPFTPSSERYILELVARALFLHWDGAESEYLAITARPTNSLNLTLEIGSPDLVITVEEGSELLFYAYQRLGCSIEIYTFKPGSWIDVLDNLYSHTGSPLPVKQVQESVS